MKKVCLQRKPDLSNSRSENNYKFTLVEILLHITILVIITLSLHLLLTVCNAAIWDDHILTMSHVVASFH